MRLNSLFSLPALLLASTRVACGVILLDSGDPLRNTATPGDNSGWQYEGAFGDFLGTPIAPRYFITAQHIGGNVGDAFVLHGETYTTTAAFSDPTSDLRLWQVDHAFPDYAPLYRSGTEVGLELRVHGRGTRRGADRTLGNRLRGWDWGAYDHVQRWGSNVVARTSVYDGAPYLEAGFDSPGIPHEAHLSSGDSGGAVFVLEEGLWKLAGVNYSVDDLYTSPDDGGLILSAVFDARGYYTKNANGSFTQIPDEGTNVPTSFYSTRVAPRLTWIESVIGQDPATLAPEAYQGWQTLYFTPPQIADAALSGLTADTDGDGIPNLLEFAFNLDPTYTESVQMTTGTGLRGLPLIRTELVSGSPRLTVEYVRRTAGSGSGITYATLFASGLAAEASKFRPGGTESVTPINARWERVKVTDTVPVTGRSPSRFARVQVTPAPPP